MVNIPDIAGSGQTVPILPPGTTDSSSQAAWVQFIVTGAGTPRIGGLGSNGVAVGPALGLPVPSGGGLFLPYQGHQRAYAMGGLFAYVPAGCSLSVAYEPFS